MDEEKEISRNNGLNKVEEDGNQLDGTFDQKQKEIQLKMLRSTQRSLRVLEKSEETAITTSEELAVQGEQLKKLKCNLNEMNSTLKKNSEHINIIKNPFGFLKNFLNNKKESFAFKISPKCDIQNKAVFVPKAMDFESVKSLSSPSFTQAEKCTSVNEKISENLQDMSFSIGRLKGLALEMGKELDTQNDLIEEITAKTDIATVTLQNQNKHINKLLK